MSTFTTVECGNTINHIVPSKYALSTIQRKISCTEPGCEKVFTLLQNMELHIMQTHKHKKFKGNKEKDLEQRFYCPIERCIYQYNQERKMKYFKKQKYLKQHYLKVHADRTFNCDICSQNFSTASYLTAHQVSCNKSIVCSCGKSFCSIPSLQTHARRSQHVAPMLNAGKKRNSVRQSLQTSTVSTKRILCEPPRSPPIQPRNQCSHITAAIALSELAVGRYKRISTVDIGIQTEHSPNKRSSRKLSNLTKDCSNVVKLRQTTETESQTNLTNLKKKNRKSRKMRSISTSSRAFDIFPDKLNSEFPICNNLSQNQRTTKFPDKLYSEFPICNNLSQNQRTTKFPVMSNQPNEFRDAEIQCQEAITHQFNMEPNTNGYMESCFAPQKGKLDSMPYIDSSMILTSSAEDVHFENAQPSSTTDKPQVDGICSTQIELNKGKTYSYMNPVVIEENMQLLEKSNTSFESVLPLPEISLTSTNLQTNARHDVFLNSNLPSICGGLTTSETQTDSCSLWCSSETQTCEDFSDIEQYLCSTIHTQTFESPDDLFPDLNFMDTYTQTG